MRITSTVFDFNIPARFFPGYKVVKPFYATVRYNYNHTTKESEIMTITFNPKILKIISLSGLTEAIRDAVINNIEHLLEEYKPEERVQYDEKFNY